ncbi:MAG: hypothetical protein LKG24_03385 [Lacticaseibacillus songhuajiangensis]|jgi:hypothetical protein|nr:hypothetical protein [Lacticaseibacillus songhuajiangensis]
MNLYKSGEMTATGRQKYYPTPGAIDAYVVRINGQSWVGRYSGELSYTLAGNPAHAMVFNEAKHAYNVAQQYGGTAIRLVLGQAVTEADTDEDD